MFFQFKAKGMSLKPLKETIIRLRISLELWTNYISCYQVHLQKNKVNTILSYCSTEVQNIIKTSPAYNTLD